MDVVVVEEELLEVERQRPRRNQSFYAAFLWLSF